MRPAGYNVVIAALVDGLALAAKLKHTDPQQVAHVLFMAMARHDLRVIPHVHKPRRAR